MYGAVHGARLDVAVLPLPPSIRSKLQLAGFRTTLDLEGVESQDLAAEAHITQEEATLTLSVVSVGLGEQANTLLSGAQILQAERKQRRIITFSPEIDSILNGGVPVGQVTEFCGVPGIGKTQMGMQLSINVQLPQPFNGLAGEAIYIDTEGSFMPERCFQMATAFCSHLIKIAKHRGDFDRIQAAASEHADNILKRIHFFRAKDYVEQLAIVSILSQYLDSHPSVRLVVVDSVAFHFRQDFEDLGARARILGQMSQIFMELASKRQIAVVLMNQVTTRIGGNQQGASQLVPALGDSWGHAATNRIILFWRDGQRNALVHKSPTLPRVAAQYAVTEEGIRGMHSKGVKRGASVLNA
jgi:RAD51-like protein 2